MFLRKIARNRFGSLALAVGYLLTVTASGFFHDHHHAHGGLASQRPGFSALYGESHGACLVCQFLAQKPAPAAAIAVVESAPLVQTILPPSRSRLSSDVFSAWQSRAPPRSV